MAQDRDFYCVILVSGATILYSYSMTPTTGYLGHHQLLDDLQLFDHGQSI